MSQKTSSPKSRAKIIWLGLWMIVLVGIIGVGKYSDSVFMERMLGGAPQPDQVFRLVPDQTDFLIYDQNLTEDWKRFKGSSLYSSLRNLSSVKATLGELGVEDGELESMQNWMVRFWGPSALICGSQNTGSFYLLSPVGTYAECVDWVQRLAESSYRKNTSWVSRQVQNQWVLEYSKSFGGKTWVMQIGVVRGVAVLAMGRNSDPINAIFDAANKSGSFSPTVQKLVEKSHTQKDLVMGFSSGVEWSLNVQSAKKTSFEVKIPAHSIQKPMVSPANMGKLKKMRQADDGICLVASWEDLKVLWSECEERLPQEWTSPVRQINPETLLGEYFKIWNPVSEKLGNELFISLGEVVMFSDKYQIPFPQVTLAIPLAEPAAFLKAVEASVLKANTEQDANLLIRKVASAGGDYYELRMGKSAWKQAHGLKQLPVFALVQGFLIVSSSEKSMEKTLQSLSQDSTLADAESRGVDFRMQMNKAPQTLQILLGALGAFSPEGDNIFLSPTAMHMINEISLVLKELGDSHLVMTYEPGVIKIAGDFSSSVN